MPVSWLDVAGTYVGPGSYNYTVAAYPGGAQLFVNSATGVDNRGRVNFTGVPAGAGNTQANSAQGPYGDPTKPLATVFGANGALSMCKAGRGDTIIVAPGHTEVLANGGAITVPAGVSIIGGGYGSARPTFNWGDATTFLQWAAAGTQFQNLIFNGAAFAAVTKMFLINQSGIQFNGCRMLQANATNQAADCIVLNAGADDFLFVNSEIDAGVTAGAVRAISNPAANAINRPQIVNNYIHGSWSGGAISILTTTAADLLIEYNTINNSNAAGFCFAFAAGNTITGLVSYCDLACAAATTAGFFSAAPSGTALYFIQIFGADRNATMNGKNGALFPAQGTN